MSKVTSKLQVTLPKAIAQAHGIRPGDVIEWTSAGDTIRVQPLKEGRLTRDKKARLRVFDQATERQRKRQRSGRRQITADRGWTREELYERGRAR